MNDYECDDKGELNSSDENECLYDEKMDYD